MDDPILAEKACMTVSRDKWLTKRGKVTPETKTQIKKATNAKKNMVEKQDKAKAKNQTLEIRQLTLSNRQAKAQLRSFKNILSDLPMGDKPSQPFNKQAPIKDPHLPLISLTGKSHITA